MWLLKLQISLGTLNDIWIDFDVRKSCIIFGAFSIQKLLWKDFYVIWWYFLPKIICANSIMQKSLNSRNWELSDLPHVPFTTICRSANFTSIKFTHAKWSWIQWFIFGNTQKNNICSLVQRFPTTAMKIIFIRGWMTKQHTYNFVEQISNMTK